MAIDELSIRCAGRAPSAFAHDFRGGPVAKCEKVPIVSSTLEIANAADEVEQ